MKLEIHPNARENFDNKIIELKSQLRFKIEKKRISKPNPDLHISGHFDETNIIGELRLTLRGESGNVSARMFGVRGKQLGLFNKDYKNLNQIAENFQKSTIPKDVISVNFLSVQIFEWIKRDYFGKTTQSPTDTLSN